MNANPPAANPGTGQRVFVTIGAGLGVAALAGGAFVLSFDDLRALALHGGAPSRYVRLYPAMFDAIVVVTLLSMLLATRAGWWARRIRELLLLSLLGGAAAASVQRSLIGYAALPSDAVKVGVAVAPWAILLIAVWLWISMFKHARQALAGRADHADRDGHADRADHADHADRDGHSDRADRDGPPTAPRHDRLHPVGPAPLTRHTVPSPTADLDLTSAGPRPHETSAPGPRTDAPEDSSGDSSGDSSEDAPEDSGSGTVAAAKPADGATRDAEPASEPTTEIRATAAVKPETAAEATSETEATSGTETRQQTTPDSKATSVSKSRTMESRTTESRTTESRTTESERTDPETTTDGASSDQESTVEEWNAAAARDVERWAKDAGSYVQSDATDERPSDTMPGSPPSSTFRSSPARPEN